MRAPPRWEERQKDFVKQTGLKRQADREQVPRFGQKTLVSGGRNGIINTGTRITNTESIAEKKHAERYYGLVRSMTTDVEKIAKNTGFDAEKIREIKPFIFMEKHDLGGEEPEYFQPDFPMAQIWQRFIEGKIKPHDLTLLRHEFMERQLMKKGMSQYDAHIQTSRVYNYAKEADEYYATLRKHKK